MISVDLNRLREAADYMDKEWSGELWDAHTAIGARPVLRATHRAVLDAPTVWWCESAKQVGCTGPADTSIKMRDAHRDCGKVALVPVEEGA